MLEARFNKERFCEREYPYLETSYDTKRRFCGYWHQIDELISIKPKSILEVGVGSSFVAIYLKNKGYSTVTVDILKALNPDVVSSVINLPFADKSFSVVSCCEVLEHIPYAQFSKALDEIHRVSQKHVVLSLPDDTAIYKFDIQLSKIMMIKKMFLDPFYKSSKLNFDGHHYWEIGKTNFPIEKIAEEIKKANFEIIKTYRVFERPFQRFFILRSN